MFCIVIWTCNPHFLLPRWKHLQVSRWMFVKLTAQKKGNGPRWWHFTLFFGAFIFRRSLENVDRRQYKQFWLCKTFGFILQSLKTNTLSSKLCSHWVAAAVSASALTRVMTLGMSLGTMFERRHQRHSVGTYQLIHTNQVSTLMVMLTLGMNTA